MDNKRLSILKNRKRLTDNHVKLGISRESVCACVCWRKHTTTAACHFSLSTKGHLFWIKWCSPPLPSALLCIYHVVYSKVIFNMRALFLVCCSTTNHWASDDCDNTQSCRVSSPHLSLVISSQIRSGWELDVLTARCIHSSQQRWSNFSLMQFLNCSLEMYSLFHQQSLMTCSLFMIFIFLFHKSDSSLKFLLFPEYF